MNWTQFTDRKDVPRGAYVQAKIIRKVDRRMYIRVWNCGSSPAYNVSFFIPEGRRLFVLRSRLSYGVLDSGKAYDEYAIADESVLDEVRIITTWQDEYGCQYYKEQTGKAPRQFSEPKLKFS